MLAALRLPTLDFRRQFFLTNVNSPETPTMNESKKHDRMRPGSPSYQSSESSSEQSDAEAWPDHEITEESKLWHRCSESSQYPKNMLTHGLPEWQLDRYYDLLREQATRLFCHEHAAKVSFYEFGYRGKGKLANV